MFICFEKGVDCIKPAEWMLAAEELFYEKGYKIVEIANIIGRSRQTITKYLKATPNFALEKEKRKKESKERKREQNKRWAKDNPDKKKQCNENWIKRNPEKHKNYRHRESNGYADTELLRLDHDRAVRELSGSVRNSRSIINEMDYYISAYIISGKDYIRRNETEQGALVPTVGLPKYVRA